LLRSLELEPDLAEGLGYIGWLRMTYDLDWKGAKESYRRALELAPSNVRALNGAGGLAYNLCKNDEAIALYRQVLVQDPLDALAHHNLGHMLFAVERLAEAEAACRSALEIAPQSFFTRALLSLIFVGQGRGADALDEAARERDDEVRLWALGIVHHALGQGPESDAALRELIEHHAEDCAFQIAEVHGARGEADAAFEWLERGLAQRDPGIAATMPSPRFRSLHGDPRWKPFLRKMGLEG
jgi:tetratricopeptide (TPR) repeat protein